jgi:RNA polymerase sigma factor (sigma-70 family)
VNEESRQIEHLKRIFDNLGQYWNSIELLLSHVSQPLLVDDRGLQYALVNFRSFMEKAIEEIKVLDIAQTFSEIKFIGKKLHQIEADIAEIKKDGIKRKIDLSFSCDGYEMVKKNSEKITSKNPEEILKELLRTLTQREIEVITHKFGLFGYAIKKTYVALGKVFGVSSERVSQIYKKAIRKLRHPSRRHLVKACMHEELIKEVLGEG